MEHRPLLIGALTALLAGTAWAQDAPAEDDDGGEVRTTTRRVRGAMADKPQRVESISGDALTRRGATNLDGALSWLGAGSSASPTGTSQSLIIDGLPTSQLTILRDGLPISRPVGSPQGPLVDLGSIAIDPSTIERIDVYRGVGPAGSGRAGGVIIDIVTRHEPARTRAFARGQFGAELLDPFRQNLAVGGTLPISDAWSTSLLAQVQGVSERDANRDTLPDSPERNTLSGEWGLSWRPNTNSFLHIGLLGNGDVTTSRGGPDAPLDDLIRRRNLRGRVQGRWWPHKDIRLDHNTDIGRYDNDFYKYVRSSQFEREKARTVQYDARQMVAMTWFLPDHDLVLEAGGGAMRVERTGETGELPAVLLADVGLGVMDTWFLHERVEIFGRAWGDITPNFGPGFNGQVGAQIKLDDTLRLRTSASRTRRIPTAEELFLAFDHTEVGYKVVGNENLDPETLNSARVGLVWTAPDKTLGFEVEGFYHRLQDVIVSQGLSSEPGTFTYENRDDAHAAGANASIQLRKLPGGLSLLANYAFLPLAADLTTGERLPQRTEHSGRAELRGQWGSVESWVDVASRGSLATPEGTAPAPPNTQLGLGIGYRWGKNVRVLLDLNNLLGQVDPTWGPVVGFHGLLSVELGYQGKPR